MLDLTENQLKVFRGSSVSMIMVYLMTLCGRTFETQSARLFQRKLSMKIEIRLFMRPLPRHYTPHQATTNY
jgi:K+ transporter